MKTIADAAFNALSAKTVQEKIDHTFRGSKAWFDGELASEFNQQAPDRPGRPAKPELLAPKDMPKRRNAGSDAARIAMLHAIAHIELNAIDLAWDIVIRFGEQMPKEFINDWVKVADDEARHFEMLDARLKEMDSFYGALPAHDGLWQSAENTAHDIMARLAIVPLVLEARGLDVTPSLIKKFQSAGDQKSVDALEIIYEEEIEHVRAGQRWFNFLCENQGLNPQEKYQHLVITYFAGNVKPPFNKAARDTAGFDESFYLPLAKKG
ncbi:ferritin-like domain-containing protein [Pseudemcibacter aquimaris]|uniref:ferritin-like domain-containing protein n=1 Tax=Pseudemcibacter aquimaris TaxID=2857064 RepID=UPI002013542D|nr:ferritin-like domain-containing protein [Pseudemcibacter aquimaris]MCC3860910.1 ferritin-like domain-containing protein [Pseudemcibacter aquimaris]WDU59729.1 ferritin-like domain-containing protein [Pseudemcibacter aquimaris]